MASRLQYGKIAPDAMHAFRGVEQYLEESELDPMLRHLVKLRASQINGCAYCIDMHSKDLMAEGETPQRMLLLDAWREAPFYSEKERAALAWTEAVTRLTDGQVPDEVFEEAKKHFSDKELVDLTVNIAQINSWNRMSIAFHSEVGTYQPKPRQHERAA
ncbi:MAG TPA: carboxymuconolactone decarboxylase family protein [Thermomicrobiales bacterium]|jgi:AhpD family alkylhydroperoxidase|nr:carboxymuconolactone decarboxylase family protein [Thermomicrobiales bacterium]